MEQTNAYLQSAKNNKNDEFYTTYETIEKEVSNYKDQMRGKTILCNCDNPFESNFPKFFVKNFNKYGLKRLICTSYTDISLNDREVSLFNKQSKGRGYILDIQEIPQGFNNDILSDCETETILSKEKVRFLIGSGDFRSQECINLLQQSDIVVTNPPFSLFREFVSLLEKHKKKYLIIGNMNAVNYKEIFPLIQNNKAWLGYHNGDMAFRVPDDSEPRKTRFWIDEFGKKWRSLGNAMWFTNLDVEYRHKILKLQAEYTPELYPTFDNYDAIYVSRVSEIPKDYDGIMAVPLTILTKYNPKQFTIIGEANHGSDNPYDLFKPMLNGKWLYKKTLIKRSLMESLQNKERNLQFRILDLFCGAGGLSYGIHQNKHFLTKVALDFNEKAAETFKKNMPETKVVVGDIRDPVIQDKIVQHSRDENVNMIMGGPPCQGFSLKGKKLGLKDPRNFLFVEFLNIVQKIEPDVFVIENVKTLLSTSSGWFKDQIVNRIESMGYTCNVGVLDAMNFGVPQSRKRAIFICSKKGEVPLPDGYKEKHVTVRDAISDLSYLESGEGSFEQEYKLPPMSAYQVKMRTGSKKLYNHVASKHKQIAIDKLKMIPPEKGKECLPDELLGKQKFSDTWGRLVWDEVSPTIDTRFDAASNGKNNHPYLNRSITPREAARIQSFDDTFIFYGSKVYIRQQIGNAVPPLLAKAIADQIYNIISKKIKYK